jgi:hypothetical protein
MLVKLTSGGYFNWMTDVLTPLCNFLRAHLNYSEKKRKKMFILGGFIPKKNFIREYLNLYFRP